METLLKMQVNPSKSSGPNLNTPLHIAALGDNLPGVKLLLSYGADIEKFNLHRYTAFLTAMESSNRETVEFFIENLEMWKNVLNLNLWSEKHGQCPIHSILRNNIPGVVQYIYRLLQSGVSPNNVNMRGNTPLLEALYVRDHETALSITRALIKFGAEANYFNTEGICPLFRAVSSKDPKLVGALFEIKTMDVNFVNMFRLTPLFYCVSHSKNKTIAHMLMKAGADPTIKGAFTMRGAVVDTASTMLVALVNHETTLLELFFEYGYVIERKWFQRHYCHSPAWTHARTLANKVPSLKSLARQSVRAGLKNLEKIPSRRTVESLPLPKTLIEYVAFY